MSALSERPQWMDFNEAGIPTQLADLVKVHTRLFALNPGKHEVINRESLDLLEACTPYICVETPLSISFAAQYFPERTFLDALRLRLSYLSKFENHTDDEFDKKCTRGLIYAFEENLSNSHMSSHCPGLDVNSALVRRDLKRLRDKFNQDDDVFTRIKLAEIAIWVEPYKYDPEIEEFLRDAELSEKPYIRKQARMLTRSRKLIYDKELDHVRIYQFYPNGYIANTDKIKNFPEKESSD